MPLPEADEYDCPVCGQGGLEPVYLLPFENRPFWICSECDALWDQAESPNLRRGEHDQLEHFMEVHGYTGDWGFVFRGGSIDFEDIVKHKGIAHLRPPSHGAVTAAVRHVFKYERRHCRKCETEQMQVLGRDGESIVCW